MITGRRLKVGFCLALALVAASTSPMSSEGSRVPRMRQERQVEVEELKNYDNYDVCDDDWDEIDTA